MKIAKLKINAKYKGELIQFLGDSIGPDYENIQPDMTVFVKEDFYFRNNSTQLNMIIIRVDTAFLYIDIIGGGGGTGWFNISWGSEKSFVKKTCRTIEGFYASRGEAIEYLE
jgi:hypothetical protein